MIKEAAAERRVECTVGRDVPHIVADELQVRKIDLGLHVAAGFDVGFAYVESHRLESQPREFDRVAPFEAAQGGDAEGGFVAGKRGIEDALCGQKPGMGIDRQSLVGLRIGAVIQPDVVGGKLYQRSCSPLAGMSRATTSPAERLRL